MDGLVCTVCGHDSVYLFIHEEHKATCIPTNNSNLMNLPEVDTDFEKILYSYGMCQECDAVYEYDDKTDRLDLKHPKGLSSLHEIKSVLNDLQQAEEEGEGHVFTTTIDSRNREDVEITLRRICSTDHIVLSASIGCSGRIDNLIRELNALIDEYRIDWHTFLKLYREVTSEVTLKLIQPNDERMC